MNNTKDEFFDVSSHEENGLIAQKREGGETMRKMLSLLIAIVAVLMAAVPALAQETLRLSAPPTDHEIRIRFWSGDAPAKTLAAITGSQSRDLGRNLREAARKGQLKPEPGRYTFGVEFVNLAYDRARGQTIRINGKDFMVPASFGTPAAGSTILVEVVNGVGSVIIKKAWVPDDAIVRIYLPAEITNAHYPPPPYRRLNTCSKEEVEGDRCGKWPNMKASEFANLVHSEDIANYHFVR